MIDNIEQQKQLTLWNNTEQSFPSSECINISFELHAKENPDSIAIVCNDKKITYELLNKKSNQLANFLISQGINANTLVGIYLNRSQEMFIALLAILKAGGAYVPLDPAYPLERINFMLEDAGIHIVLTDSQYVTDLPQTKCSCICLDKLDTVMSKLSVTNPVNGTNSENLVYVIYTSGSTGRPKGVKISHSNVQNYSNWFINSNRINKSEKFDFSSSLSFDLSVTSTLVPLMHGAEIIICSESIKQQPNHYLKYLTDNKISLIKLTPTYFKQLLLAVKMNHKANSLKIIILGGEALVYQDIKEWLSIFPKHIIINEYGPTEATVGTIAYTISSDIIDSCQSSVPIGKPIYNTQIYILNEQHDLCSIGEIGELYIGGASVSEGYLNRSELTAERFIKNQFTDTQQKIIYRTGDLGRYCADGNIEYLGRIDHQVKIRGYRIELGEVESTLLQHPNLSSVYVQAVELQPGNKQLVAYIVCVDKNIPGVFELRLFLGKKLPNYMIPSYFITLEHFPLTKNGKLDRDALPMPGKLPDDMDYAPPGNELEEKLALIWQQVLGMDKVGVNDNFFFLGGDSILAAQILMRIESGINVDLSLAELYEFPTIAGLGPQIEKKIIKQKEQEEKALTDLLEQIENMSEDEVISQLSAEN